MFFCYIFHTFQVLKQIIFYQFFYYHADILGTVDYVNDTNGYCAFRTSPMEKDRLIFQIGSSNPDRAVALARMIQNDVSGIDINMGCPKPFSTKLGMGAALLSSPDNAKNILRNLVKNIPLPITCKIR